MSLPITTLKLVDELVNARYDDPGSFTEFAERLEELGISFFHYDVLADVLRFYSNDSLAHTIKGNDIEQARSQWIPGMAFDLSALQNAIERFDSHIISAVKFHEEIFIAGVIFCSVFLSHRCIIYLGADGQVGRVPKLLRPKY